MVVLLEDVLGLVDEHRGALQALPAVGDLLGQLAQLHHLGGHGGSGGAQGEPLPDPGAVTHHRNVPMALGREHSKALPMFNFAGRGKAPGHSLGCSEGVLCDGHWRWSFC